MLDLQQDVLAKERAAMDAQAQLQQAAAQQAALQQQMAAQVSWSFISFLYKCCTTSKQILSSLHHY